MNNELLLIIIIAVAGVLGTGLGGVFGTLFSSKAKSGIKLTMPFSIGIMLGLVIFSIIPESVELSSISETVACILIGVLVGCIVDIFISRVSLGRDVLHVNVSLRNSGLLFVVAVSIHNLPEGLALGAGAHHNIPLGLTWALLITLHNIPMGMSISIPFAEGGKSKGFSIGITALVGSTLLVGGIIGLLLGEISLTFMAATLSTAGGILLFVVYNEIAPMIRKRIFNLWCAAFIILGIVLSFIVTSISAH